MPACCFRMLMLVAPTLAGLLPMMVELVIAWRSHPDYSHGWLAAPLGAWLLWERLRRTVPSAPRMKLGIVEVLLGSLLLAAFQVLPWGLLGFLGFATLLRGLLLTMGGRAWADAALLPTLFLGLLFPLPVVWTDAAAVWLQHQVAIASAAALNLVSVCVRQGTTLHLAGLAEPVVVAEACSGLRQLLAFLGLAILVGCLLRRPAWQVLLLLVLAVPVALVTNLARVLIMVAISSHWGSDWLSGWLHDLPAVVTLPLGAAAFLIVLAILPNPKEHGVPKQPCPPWPPAPVPHLSVILALVQVLLHWHLASVTPPVPGDLRESLASLPTSIKTKGLAWDGRPTELAPERRQQLDFADDFLHRQYRDAKGELPLQLYLCFSRRGIDRQHHPEVCLGAVGGAAELAESRARLPLGGGEVQRLQFRHGTSSPLLIYYWHYSLPAGEPTTPWSILQRLHQQVQHRPASVTVQLSTTVPLARMAELEMELLPAIHRQLQALLPPGCRLACDRLAVRLVALP